ncbi:glycosyltransferase family 4 protein [Patescibacteria group bacterium]|nr:glycosyltransferase family 4 protein [Patescibacteria group bacterium]
MDRKKPDYIVYIHRIYSDKRVKKGGLDIVFDYLISKGKKILLIEFPLYYKSYNRVIIRYIDKKEEKVLRDIATASPVEIVCWPLEFFISLYYTFKYKALGKVVISADPLTSFPAVVLRKLNFFKFHYYHSVDYSTNRFSSKLINTVYSKMLVFAVRSADLVGAVSPPMKKELEKMGAKQTFLLPNSVDYNEFEKYRVPTKKRKKHSLVATCAGVTNKLFMIFDFIRLVNKLKKTVPDISLDIIGPHDPEDKQFKEMAEYISKNKLDKNIKFHGLVPKTKNLEIISKCMLGLAFHNKEISHVEFADSLKIREYAALGLPIIANDATYTSHEMRKEKAGILISNATKANKVIEELFEDKKRYSEMSKSALEWSKKMDKKAIVDTLFSKYFLDM